MPSVSRLPFRRDGVPTQTRLSSDSATAAPPSVVAESLPAATSSLSSRSSPGSTTGARPAFTPSTLAAVMSTPITRWPRAAKRGCRHGADVPQAEDGDPHGVRPASGSTGRSPTPLSGAAGVRPSTRWAMSLLLRMTGAVDAVLASDTDR